MRRRTRFSSARWGTSNPASRGFGSISNAFHKNPLFLGIRCGYLWDRNLATELPKPDFIADLKFLAEAGLEMDVVGGPSLLNDVVTITDRVPELRIVIDHLPYDAPTDPKVLRELGKRRQVYVKVSNVLRRVANRVPADLAYYRPALDELWDVFGADRLIYGSNWPVSDRVAPYDRGVSHRARVLHGEGQGRLR